MDVWIFLPVSLAAAEFLKAFASEAGKDAWQGIRRSVRGIYEARRHAKSPKGAVFLTDQKAKEEVLLLEDLPDEAWQQLLEIDVSETDSGQLSLGSKNQIVERHLGGSEVIRRAQSEQQTTRGRMMLR